MKKLTYLFSLLIVAGVAITFSACSEDDPIPDSPMITSPTGITNVGVGEAVTVDFTVSVPGGFRASNAVPTGGTANITADGTVGATTATISVEFTAGTTAGAGQVTLTVTDNNNKSSAGVATFNIAAEPVEPNVIEVTENVTADVTWETGKTYILTKRIAVEDGATLTIEPGTVVKGRAGQEANASALIVARGAKILAEGTAASPIIFTAEADAIMPGDIASPNLPPTQNNQWGGVIILGRAPISVASNNETEQIEGIPPSDTNGLYGGSDAADDSGILRYVSIRHGGTNIGDGNEINGLTLGGVGSGTTIEFVEVVANQDDGIEWFGGTVNVTNALVWNAGDDAIDTDQAWAGTLENFIVIAGSDTDHALELDGPEGDLRAGHTITKGWIKGAGLQSDTELGNLRDDAFVTVSDVYFFNFPSPLEPDGDGGTLGRGDFDLSDSQLVADGGDVTVADLEAVTPPTAGQDGDGNDITWPAAVLTDVFKDGTDAHAAFIAEGAQTGGADPAPFASWTWADNAGAIQ